MNQFSDQRLDRSAVGVAGERGIPAVAQALSFQARVSNFIALGVTLALATSLLLWYYAHAVTRSAQARHTALPGGLGHVQSEMALPPLGPIEPPRLRAPVAPASEAGVASAPSTQAAIATDIPPLTPAETELAPSRQGNTASFSASSRPAIPTALQRRLSGATFEYASTSGVAIAPAPSNMTTSGGPLAAPVPVLFPAGADEVNAAGPPLPAARVGPADGLSSLLKDPGSSVASARLQPNLSLLLPQGSFIDCTLETGIDSSLPGMTTCVTATDTFSADGGVVLLERGTKLVGETRGQVQQGVGRVFVLWTEARTPSGVIVPLDSPGADELGRSGLPGQVERHFWQRFGAAVLVSVIDGAVQAGVQASTSRGGTIIYSPGGAQDVMSEILKGTVAIPPTVIKHNGDRIEVLVARDVDFDAVYELRTTRRAR